MIFHSVFYSWFNIATLRVSWVLDLSWSERHWKHPGRKEGRTNGLRTKSIGRLRRREAGVQTRRWMTRCAILLLTATKRVMRSLVLIRWDNSPAKNIYKKNRLNCKTNEKEINLISSFLLWMIFLNFFLKVQYNK